MKLFSSYDKSSPFQWHLHSRRGWWSILNLLNLTLEVGIPGDVMWSLIDGKHIVSVTHPYILLVDKVDDCLDEEIEGGTEDWFNVADDNHVTEDGGAKLDIMLSRPKCNFWFRKLLDPMKSRMKVVLSVRVGVSGVLCHLDSLMGTLELMSGIYMCAYLDKIAT